MRIIFFGTSSFAAKILSFLLKNSFPVVAVVTQPDRPRGRHLHSSFSPVKEIALSMDPPLPVLQPEKISTPENAEVLKNYHPDLFLVVAYGEIIKKNLLELPRLGPYNIHASLLPKYRGAAPIQRCLMDGEKKTGINIIEMTPQMDAGDIVASAEIPIGEEMTFGELEHALCDLACELTAAFLKDISQGKITKMPQDPAHVTFAPKLQAGDERVDWNKPACILHNLIRALSPSPGAWCPIYLGKEEKRLKIKRALVVPVSQSVPPGTLIASGKERCIVSCQEDALQLLEVQLEGKKSMPAIEFLKGVRQHFTFVKRVSTT
jgi:methionyl-tRNA formyltransferase